ncbi:hypothetical protein HCJ93_08400 [Streptomyces sp. SBST2-5]|jgi:hypothetical protein|uniref:Uncharacterized protein n=1 Tax=Streptomyces composti TaxID=2720025 RepID=A0ABX1A3V3_9ACTN|nr:hypothetical protein [Streptomyces composti]NJP50091.1 hypothetical protein [Streptomyces composti]
MNWWTTLGNYLNFFEDAPALAVDFALNGPNANYIGYGLAYGMQASATPIDVYPSELSFTEPEV